ncbi:secreted protein [Melampsora americana]|nr:secreted protein [Melampsora americana]
MVPNLLRFILAEFSVLYVGPALVYYTTANSRVPKFFRPVLPLLNLLLISLFIASSFPILIWLTANFFIKNKTKSSSPLILSPPTITITPPTEEPITNLPPSFEEQDQNFLTTYRRSRPRRRRSHSRDSSYEPGSLADLVHRVVCTFLSSFII